MNEIEQLKLDEGFRAEPYKCSLGFLTIGYGTKLPLSKYEKEHIVDIRYIDKEQAQFLLEHRLGKYIHELLKEKPFIRSLSKNRQGVLFNMSYQLGLNGLLGFKKMFEALEKKDFLEASIQMKNSKWARQTPARANRLIIRMKDD